MQILNHTNYTCMCTHMHRNGIYLVTGYEHTKEE